MAAGRHYRRAVMTVHTRVDVNCDMSEGFGTWMFGDDIDLRCCPWSARSTSLRASTPVTPPSWPAPCGWPPNTASASGCIPASAIWSGSVAVTSTLPPRSSSTTASTSSARCASSSGFTASPCSTSSCTGRSTCTPRRRGVRRRAGRGPPGGRPDPAGAGHGRFGASRRSRRTGASRWSASSMPTGTTAPTDRSSSPATWGPGPRADGGEGAAGLPGGHGRDRRRHDGPHPVRVDLHPQRHPRRLRPDAAGSRRSRRSGHRGPFLLRCSARQPSHPAHRHHVPRGGTMPETDEHRPTTAPTPPRTPSPMTLVRRGLADHGLVGRLQRVVLHLPGRTLAVAFGTVNTIIAMVLR